MSTVTKRDCPLCGEPFAPTQSRVTYSEEGPMFAMLVHRDCRDVDRAIRAAGLRPAQCNQQEKP